MKLPTNSLIQYPSGRWGFVGRVDAELAYVDAATGGPATPEQMKDARQFGPRLARVKERAWDTAEEALAAARAVGERRRRGK